MITRNYDGTVSGNYFPLHYKHNLEINPQDFVVTEKTCAEVERQAAEQRAKQPAPVRTTTDLRVEYNSLRRKLFELQQNARSLETKTNELAGKVHNLEQRLSEVLTKKKAFAKDNNLLGERHQEHTAKALEVEIEDAVKEFEQHKRWSASAFRELRNFDGHARLAELKACFGDGVHPQANQQLAGKVDITSTP